MLKLWNQGNIRLPGCFVPSSRSHYDYISSAHAPFCGFFYKKSGYFPGFATILINIAKIRAMTFLLLENLLSGLGYKRATTIIV